MSPDKKELIIYETIDGRSPYERWYDGLKDFRAQDIVDKKLGRLQHYGHIGDCEWVGNGVYEIKIYYGPGYRVYFAKITEVLIVLLCGGDKSSQSRDIQKAQEYLQEYISR